MKTVEHPRLPLSGLNSTEFNDAVFERIVAFARQEAGLTLTTAKRNMVQSRLARHLAKSGCATYAELLENAKSNAEANDKLISTLTTNVSSFFRESHHFQAFQEQILPGLIAKAKSGHPVRIWSAGCSTGQEAYSIAMVARSLESDLQNFDLRILATDIDRQVLERARRGSYAMNELASIPDQYRKFATAQGQADASVWSIDEATKALVSFKQLNLIGDWPMKKQFDVIFCRNVLIYFDKTTQASLWPRFENSLIPNGWLFLGHSERIHDAARHGFNSTGVTIYQKAA